MLEVLGNISSLILFLIIAFLIRDRISLEDKAHLLAVPRLAAGKDQAEAILNVLHSWYLIVKVQKLCSHVTAYNTGNLNGSCVFLEEELEK